MVQSLPTTLRSEAPVFPACDPALLRRLYAEAHNALRRYRGFSGSDRDDLAQRVVCAAVARLDTYRAGKGTLRQWVRGIVHHEVAFYGRTQARRREHETGGSSEAAEITTPDPWHR